MTKTYSLQELRLLMKDFIEESCRPTNLYLMQTPFQTVTGMEFSNLKAVAFAELWLSELGRRGGSGRTRACLRAC